MSLATALVVILAAGLASQVVASLLRIPAIVVLICVGLVLGPFTQIITIPVPPEVVSEVVGLGVAVILFEHRKCKVEPRRKTGRAPHMIVGNENRLGIHDYGGITNFQNGGGLPMRCDAPIVDQARLGQKKDAGAYRAEPAGVPAMGRQPLDQVFRDRW